MEWLALSFIVARVLFHLLLPHTTKPDEHGVIHYTRSYTAEYRTVSWVVTALLVVVWFQLR